MRDLKEFQQGDYATYINDYLGPHHGKFERTTIPEEAAYAIIHTLYEISHVGYAGRTKMCKGKDIGRNFINKGFVCFLDEGNVKSFVYSHDFNWYLYIVRTE